MAKAALRRTARTRRAALDAVYMTTADGQITAKLLRLLTEAAVTSVGLYAALPGEVDVDGLLVPLRAAGTAVAFPRITRTTTGPAVLRFHAVDSIPTMRRGRPPIREPRTTDPLVEPPALLVVPGLAFDRLGGRLGYGGGFYDRYLARHPGIRTLGVCHERMLVEHVPTAVHDVGVDAVVTEAGVYR